MTETRATRTTQTRARIKAALVDAISEKGFDALTVSDLTRRAGINRGTFYLHFIDKYDLLEQLEDEFIARIETALLANRAETDAPSEPLDMFPYATVLEALSLVRSDFAFVSAISGPGGDPDFSGKLKRVIESILDLGLRRSGARVASRPDIPAAYARELVLGHVLTIIEVWLSRGGAETPEQVARMICAAKDLSPAMLVE